MSRCHVLYSGPNVPVCGYRDGRAAGGHRQEDSPGQGEESRHGVGVRRQLDSEIITSAVLCSAPSVPQPVVQSLLGPSPG